MAVHLGIQFLFLDSEKSALYPCQTDINCLYSFRFKFSGLVIIFFLETASPLTLTTGASPPAGKVKIYC